MKKDKQNSQTQEQGEVKELNPAPQESGNQQEVQPQQARFIGHVVKLKNRAEEVIYYGTGLFRVTLQPYYLEATDLRNGVITRLPYSNIDFMKEVPK